jgi:hypothetical protein
MAEIDDLKLRISRLEKSIGQLVDRITGVQTQSNLVGVKEYIKRFTTTDHGELSGLADPDHVETSLLLSNNTTNDSTIARHGFLPKLSNVATQYMNGVGTWTQVDHTNLANLTTGDPHTQYALLTDLPDLFPIGAVYITTVNTNPGTLIGFGTWGSIGNTDFGVLSKAVYVWERTA